MTFNYLVPTPQKTLLFHYEYIGYYCTGILNTLFIMRIAKRITMHVRVFCGQYEVFLIVKQVTHIVTTVLFNLLNSDISLTAIASSLRRDMFSASVTVLPHVHSRPRVVICSVGVVS